MKILLVLGLLCSIVSGDIYMHNPRGSNNRNAESGADRSNNNRLFDSQNNNKGGHNVGDKLDTGAKGNSEKQYNMKYFQSHESDGVSYLPIVWNMQHGCGDEEGSNTKRLDCDVVIQMMCQPTALEDSDDAFTRKAILMRDGSNTNKINYPTLGRNSEKLSKKGYYARFANPSNGLHESLTSYDVCAQRQRNTNLFTADQNLGDADTAKKTRQNPGGTRSGYECPEERDYYPYWHPSQWKDIAIMTDRARCSYYLKESFNVKPKHECVHEYNDGSRRKYSRYNNKETCNENRGVWRELHNYLEKISDATTQEQCMEYDNSIWAIPYDSETGNTKECLIRLDAPECLRAPLTRSNHNGNAYGGHDEVGKFSNYMWKIPQFPSGNDQRCVLRIRYNISTGDVPRTWNASNNEQFTNNPRFDFGLADSAGVKMPSLKLAINTAQFSRTFQDRSHIFILRQRPDKLTGDLHNLNVRGKRGNAQQTYPGTEYDFTPTDLKINDTDLVHIQWTGSNTNTKNFDGQGKAGTDRSNIVQIKSRDVSIPLTFENSNMFQNAEIKWIHNGQTDMAAEQLALDMATAGYTSCTDCTGGGDLKNLDIDLNNAPASYEGAVLQFKAGVYHYMSSRNNAFTNRAQKATIEVIAT